MRPEHPSVVFAAHVETTAGLELPADFISQLASAAHEVDGIVARFAEALDKVVSA